MDEDKKDAGDNRPINDNGPAEDTKPCLSCNNGTMRKKDDKWVCDNCSHEMPA